jgi:FKBP-type peptidyl-prolyl cis-trans isomerase FkpA
MKGKTMLERMRRRACVSALLLVALTTGACGEDAPTGPDFDPSLGVDLSAMTRTGSGLYVLDLVVGTGTLATTGSMVVVRYSGWLTNGTRFDAGDFPFRLGQRRAIDGFDQGVLTMRVGGKRRIVVPPSLGYGASGSGSIPPNAYLLFELELLSVSP